MRRGLESRCCLLALIRVAWPCPRARALMAWVLTPLTELLLGRGAARRGGWSLVGSFAGLPRLILARVFHEISFFCWRGGWGWGWRQTLVYDVVVGMPRLDFEELPPPKKKRNKEKKGETGKMCGRPRAWNPCGTIDLALSGVGVLRCGGWRGGARGRASRVGVGRPVVRHGGVCLF